MVASKYTPEYRRKKVEEVNALMAQGRTKIMACVEAKIGPQSYKRWSKNPDNPYEDEKPTNSYKRIKPVEKTVYEFHPKLDLDGVKTLLKMALREVERLENER